MRPHSNIYANLSKRQAKEAITEFVGTSKNINDGTLTIHLSVPRGSVKLGDKLAMFRTTGRRRPHRLNTPIRETEEMTRAVILGNLVQEIKTHYARLHMIIPTNDLYNELSESLVIKERSQYSTDEILMVAKVDVILVENDK